jgi:hypothetical protein
VKAVIKDLGVVEQRRRKIPSEVGVLLSVAMNLFTQESLEQVLVKLLKGLRFIWPDPTVVPATKSAICQARYRLGARPVVELYRRVCLPMATENTPGAFLFGRRLMAIDGTVEEVPDTPENAQVFGRHHGAGALPPFLKSRRSTWWSAAPTPSSTLASGPAIPAKGWVAGVCCVP